MSGANQPGQMVALNALRHDEREGRRVAAWSLRLEGFTTRQIADRLKISVGTVSDYLEETLAEVKEMSRESAGSWRQLQLDRLDAVVATWLPVSRDPSHPEAARGAVIVVRACEAQSRLLGLLQANPMLPGTDKPTEPLDEQLARSPALRAAVRAELDKADAIARAQAGSAHKAG